MVTIRKPMSGGKKLRALLCGVFFGGAAWWIFDTMPTEDSALYGAFCAFMSVSGFYAFVKGYDEI